MIESPVLILGSRSDIGRALARAYAAKGADVILAARSRPDEDAADAGLRHEIKARAVSFDVNDADPDRFFDDLGVVPGTVVMVAGSLGDQDRSAAADAEADLVFRTNFTGPARYLLAAARRMQAKPNACIIGISSVAGDRGRASNFIYGSAKAGLTAFLSGLRNAHAKTGLHVITVKPGFVRTRMTEGMKLIGPLTASPETVANAIIKAQGKRQDVVYTLGAWRWVMAIINHIPERIFKKLSL
jgi:NAD(P)-dependent dehydrogenase (short-subunit alcohol dehydrogenase family)